MPHCAAIGCTNKSSSRSKAQLELEKYNKISFHSFPKNSDKRKAWIDCMGLTEASLPKYPHLCSCHFSSKSFDRTSAWKIRLKDNAVPSVFKVHDVANAATSQDSLELQEKSSMSIDEEITKLKCSRTDEASTVNAVEEQIRKKQKIVISPHKYRTKDSSSQTPPQPQLIDKATWVSKFLIANSPTKTHLRSIIRNQKVSYEKHIKLLKQRTRRKEKRIALLKNVLIELKKHIQLTDNELDVSRNIGTSTKDLLKRVARKSEHAVVPKKFAPDLRSLE